MHSIKLAYILRDSLTSSLYLSIALLAKDLVRVLSTWTGTLLWYLDWFDEVPTSYLQIHDDPTAPSGWWSTKPNLLVTPVVGRSLNWYPEVPYAHEIQTSSYAGWPSAHFSNHRISFDLFVVWIFHVVDLSFEPSKISNVSKACSDNLRRLTSFRHARRTSTHPQSFFARSSLANRTLQRSSVVDANSDETRFVMIIDCIEPVDMCNPY